jgi:hypothetical protein
MILLYFFIYFYCIFETYIFFSKSQKENEKWTFLKMSKIRNPNKVLKIAVFSRCDHDAQNYFFELKKM